MLEIAVTGATGFVGRAVVAKLLEQGVAVSALARNRAALPRAEGLRIVGGDLSNRESLERLLEGTAGVVHCAALTKALGAADFVRVNAGGTLNLLEAMRTLGRKRLVLVSSLAARRPELSPYAASKRAAEDAVLSSGLDGSIVRPPAVYGPGDLATLPFFRQAERGLLLLPVPPRQRFSVIYVDDLADLLVRLAMQEDRRDAEAIECDDGTPGGYSWPDFATAAGEAAGRRVRFLPLPRALAWPLAISLQGVARISGRPQIFSPGKLREMSAAEWLSRTREPEDLDWRPEVDLLRGLAATRLWYKERGLL